MKEATGELNMTVIVVIAIAAIAALFYVFVWPMIQTQLAQRTCETFGPDFNAVRTGSGDEETFLCCPGNATSGPTCITPNP